MLFMILLRVPILLLSLIRPMKLLSVILLSLSLSLLVFPLAFLRRISAFTALVLLTMILAFWLRPRLRSSSVMLRLLWRFHKMKVNRDLIFSNPGEEIRIDYSPRVQPDGTIELEPSGKFNLQEWYDSQAAGCDMHLIVQRYLSGDTDVLSRVQGIGFDATAYPKTYAEMLQHVIDGQRLFDALPPDVRREYDNDFNRFFAAAGNDNFYSDLMTRLNPSAPAAPAATSAEGESSASS